MQTIQEDQNRSVTPWQFFGGPEPLNITRDGEIRCFVNSRSWQLEKDIKVRRYGGTFFIETEDAVSYI
jgi:hypothetical protein